MTSPDSLLIEQIRDGKPEAWTQFIAQYEGRLLSFVQSRLRRRAFSEDVVQETFIGFLTSLPNYDTARPLEGYLFSIAAHKLTDHLRREGRRPTIPLSTSKQTGGDWELPGNARKASSMMRSGERKKVEETSIIDCISEQIEKWRSKGDWKKLMCLELLFAGGTSNKEVSESTGLTEQQVANYKFDFLSVLRKLVRKQGLSEDMFPELQPESES